MCMYLSSLERDQAGDPAGFKRFYTSKELLEKPDPASNRGTQSLIKVLLHVCLYRLNFGANMCR